ncbi:MAG: penicillin-binding protein 2 [Thermoleophilia bacterium]|nr:penicillin-binding protein 2 [Thermoleophilia bacterium]
MSTRNNDREREAQPALTVALSKRRMTLLLTLLLILLTAIAARTLYLQSVKNNTLAHYAQSQQQNTQLLPAVRGPIEDRNGQELAVGEEAITFYVTPKLMKDPIETAATLARILKLPRGQSSQLLSRLTNDPTSGFAYVMREVPKIQADKLIAAKTKMDTDLAARVAKLPSKPKKPPLHALSALGYYPEQHRIYPLGSVGAQLMGAVNVDGKGIAGLESLYDRSLSGTSGKQVVVRDPAGTPLDVLSLRPEVDGRTVQLTIDSTIQTEVERVLAETMKKFNAKGATALVMNPRTGELLAMASAPTIDANDFGNANSDWQRNRAITDTYEPGSTFKIVTISGALEDQVTTPTRSYFLPVNLPVADKMIHDAERRPAVRMTTREILVESSNVGTVKIGIELGKARLAKWIKRFGFGAPTGIDFPGEVQGLVLAPDEWSGSTIGNVPIGQGVGVTAIQLASAYAAIANDGVLVKPHLLKSVGGEPVPKTPSRRVLSTQTSQIMRTMFGDVVSDERGTGNLAQIPGYAVAGKTGTANKAEHGVYVKGKYVSSFIGFVPARNPQLLTLVVVDEPDVPWGGTVAAPAFEQISEFALQYLAIPPDGIM